MAITSSGKKNNNKKRIHPEIERVTVHSGRSADAVPHQNVLDLRSVVAKREVSSARVKRIPSAVAPKRTRHEEGKSTKQKTGGLFARWRTTAPAQPKPAVPHQLVQQSIPEVIGIEAFADLFTEEVVPLPPKKQNTERTDTKTRHSILKPTLAFAVLAMVFVLPASVSAVLSQASSVKNTVSASAEEAFAHLYAAGQNFQDLNFAEAKKECDIALEGFTAAQDEIANVNPFLATMAEYLPGTGKQFTSARALLQAGEELSLAGQQLSQGLAVLSTVDVGSVAQSENGKLTDVLVVAHSALSPAAEHLANASRVMRSVSVDAVPEDKQQFVILAQEALPEIESTLNNGVSLTETLLAFLGNEEPKRYLVLFQNNHEIRPTGGFIGSLAIVDIENGIVKELEVPGGGVYDISGQLTEQVISPQPLQVVNPAWNLQDANWFPHFPASAEKIQWFFEHSKAPDVDGVLTVVPSVIEKLLAITGPIDLTQEYDVVITEDNFYDEVQRRAEEKYDVTRESKKIIGAMTPVLLNQLFSQASTPEGLLNIVGVLRDALAEKDILVYMNDPRLQEDFSSRDWSGELKLTDRDYLGIFHANIGGGKTDSAVEQVVKHRAEIALDGSIVDTVTLTRVHKGESDEEFRATKNLDYVRFYVPEGSRLISANGFETPSKELFLDVQPGYTEDEDLAAISGEIESDDVRQVFTNTEFEKTVFGGWIQTESGSSSTVTLTYQLPFTLQTNGFWNAVDHYSLLVQKQPGSFGDFFTSDVVLADNKETIRTYPTDYTGSLQTVLKQDLFVGMVIAQN